MRLVPQRIQKKNVQSFQLAKRRLRNFTVIREISRFAKTKSVDLRLSMDQSHRLEARAKDLHRPIDRPKFKSGQSAEFVIAIEDVAEHLAQKSGRVRTRVERQSVRLVAITQWPQIINAQDVVGVRVRVKNRVHPRDALANGLRIKIWSRIDQHYLARKFQHDRRSCAPVVRIA